MKQMKIKLLPIDYDGSKYLIFDEFEKLSPKALLWLQTASKSVSLITDSMNSRQANLIKYGWD